MPLCDRARGVVRDALRLWLAAAMVGWALDLPVRVGWHLYTEQVTALAAGICAALALLAPARRPESRPGSRSASRAGEAARLALAALALGGFLYVALRYPEIQLDLAFAPASAVALGAALIVAALAAVWRRTGPALPLLVAGLVLFALFVGPHLPPTYATRPVSAERLAVYLAFDANALLSKMLDIAFVTIAPFILFGALLNGFGGAAAATRAVARAVGGLTGGAAKVAVIGSGLFGAVSGSAVANVAAVGSVTIPMMARAGYPRPVAGGIEAAASTGGQLLPPIMGAAAFLMAEILEIPYAQVALAALLPGLLYYAAILLAVDFEARRRPETALEPGARLVVADPPRRAGGPAWRHLIPVGLLVWLLFVLRMSEQKAGLLAVAALIAAHVLWPAPGALGRLAEAIRGGLDAMEQVAEIVLLAAAAGLVIGVLNLTGVSFAVTMQMLAAAGGDMALLLALTAGLCMLLGLGMPTVGVYILLATLAAPALARAGADPLAAHMFVAYFGMLSMITPPVALASFAAATVARADPWATSFAAMRVGLGLYAVPVAFVNMPELMLQPGTGALPAALAALRALLAVALITAASVGHVARPLGFATRLLALGLAVPNLLAFGGDAPDAALAGATAAGAALMWRLARAEAPETRAAGAAAPREVRVDARR